MKKRIIYLGFLNECEGVIDFLYKKYDWDPVYIISAARMRESAEEKYKHAVFCDSSDLRNARFDYSQIGEAVPIDKNIIGALSQYESFCLDLVEDTTGWNFSFHERRRYYYDVLRYWNTVLQHSKPDIFVSWTTPHGIIDYPIYLLCKYYGIQTLYINPTPIFNHEKNKYHHVGTSLENQSNIFNQTYHSDETYELDDAIKKYFESIRSKKGMEPPYITYFYNNTHKHWNPGLWSNFGKECARFLKLALTGKFFKKIDIPWKANRHPFESKKSRMSYPQYVLFKEQMRRKDVKTRKIYEPFITEADLNKKYVYYAAAVHPEAGIWSVYQDQLLILDMLSKTMPDDWVIYYKEHPYQLMEGGKGSLTRSIDYYRKIAAYKNIQMVSTEVSTFELIDSAQFVATPGGTVGWETIVRGVPALIFGSVWYQGCNSIMKIESFQDCIDAVDKIKNGFRPDPSDIERFSAAVAKVSAKNIIHGDFVADQIKACDDTQREMERIADLYYEGYKRYYLDKEIPEFQTVAE